MDRNSATRKIINIRRRIRCRLSFVLIFLLLALLVDLKVALKAEASKDSASGFVSSHEAANEAAREIINMEEMKIQGNFNKPNVMYVIPRANLPIEMKLNDDYFLPSSVDSEGDNETVGQTARWGMAREIPLPFSSPPFSSSKSPSYANEQDMKEGSCVCCHYREMVIPKNSGSGPLLRELDQTCLQCHNSSYYHICWREVAEMIFHSDDRIKEASSKSLPIKGLKPLSGGNGQDSSENICQKCHPGWTQQKEKTNIGGYDTDNFCLTCHKRKGY